MITVPAYFNDAQRQATKDAGRIADSKFCAWSTNRQQLRWPTGSTRRRTARLRSTTSAADFDISILKLHDGIFEVIATNGDTHLGGDDIDNLLIAIALDDIRGDLGIDSAATAKSCRRSAKR